MSIKRTLMRQPQPITSDQVKERVAQIMRTERLIKKCWRDAFLGPPRKILSTEEFLRKQIYGDEEPDLLTRRQQLEQIRAARKENASRDH